MKKPIQEPKKRVRGARFEAMMEGAVWRMEWDPKQSRLRVRRKGARRSYSIGVHDIVDAATGQRRLPL